MPDTFETVTYELLGDGQIARVTMNRPEARNAQNRKMTYELNDALTTAALDGNVKVIILAGAGPHFSSGHDLRDRAEYDGPPLSMFGGSTGPSVERHLEIEQEVFLQMCKRWYELPKPTIAQVQGKAIAGGLMLLWVCDLIVASEDAEFSDPTVGMGANGVEWFAHPWELGVRKAKEMLFTGGVVSAADAHRLGMVNHVVPRADLEAATVALAERIAARPSTALKLAKLSVNQARDAQGFWTAQQAAFSLHQLATADDREKKLRDELRAGSPT
jgi:enoyl-CoA hydratase